MFEEYKITTHAIERYAERMNYSRTDIIKKIKGDLYFTKTKKIINEGNIRHIFTSNGKEFIFVKDGRMWILRTVIKYTRSDFEKKMRNLEKKVKAMLN